jgi:hypothetical protein
VKLLGDTIVGEVGREESDLSHNFVKKKVRQKLENHEKSVDTPGKGSAQSRRCITPERLAAYFRNEWQN